MACGASTSSWLQVSSQQDDFLAEHPVDRANVEAHKERRLVEVRAYRLRELREDTGLTQQ